jgi:ABC-type lipoprotein release transport system permease subunit
MTFAAVAVAMTAVALAASWVPAYRASRTDPMEALRHG